MSGEGCYLIMEVQILKIILGIDIPVSIKNGIYYCDDRPYRDQQYAKKVYELQKYIDGLDELDDRLKLLVHEYVTNGAKIESINRDISRIENQVKNIIEERKYLNDKDFE